MHLCHNRRGHDGRRARLRDSDKVTNGQIILAVQYLHSVGIVHRDIKPENILYATKADDAPVKLVDFGLGKMIDLHGTTSMSTVCGTPSYLAPEVVQRKGYGQECDVWSAGIILYILLCGFPPFDQGKSVPALFKDILEVRASQHISGLCHSSDKTLNPKRQAGCLTFTFPYLPLPYLYLPLPYLTVDSRAGALKPSVIAIESSQY